MLKERVSDLDFYSVAVTVANAIFFSEDEKEKKDEDSEDDESYADSKAEDSDVYSYDSSEDGNLEDSDEEEDEMPPKTPPRNKKPAAARTPPRTPKYTPGRRTPKRAATPPTVDDITDQMEALNA